MIAWHVVPNVTCSTWVSAFYLMSPNLDIMNVIITWLVGEKQTDKHFDENNT